MPITSRRSCRIGALISLLGALGLVGGLSDASQAAAAPPTGIEASPPAICSTPFDPYSVDAATLSAWYPYLSASVHSDPQRWVDRLLV